MIRDKTFNFKFDIPSPLMPQLLAAAVKRANYRLSMCTA